MLLAVCLAPWLAGAPDGKPSGMSLSKMEPSLRPAGAWAEAFDDQWRQTRGQVQSWARSGDSWQHYSLAYSIDALTSAYLATGRTSYVQDGLDLLADVIATSRPSTELRDSSFHDRYRGWASHFPQDRGDEVALYESYLWRYGTGLLRVVRQDPVLWEQPSLRTAYAGLLAAATQDVFDKWWSRGADSYIYRERVHLSAHWALIAINLSLIDPTPSRRAHYVDIVRRFVQGSVASGEPGLRTQLVPSPVDPAAWFWSDVWGSYDLPGQDVSHGSAVVAFAVEAHSLGILSDDDLGRFRRTFTAVVWPRAGAGAGFVDGSGEGSGWFSDGFVKLGRYDAGLQARLEQHQPANGQFYAALALNAAVLACGHSATWAGTDGVLLPPACRPTQGLLPVDPSLVTADGAGSPGGPPRPAGRVGG